MQTACGGEEGEEMGSLAGVLRTHVHPNLCSQEGFHAGNLGRPLNSPAQNSLSSDGRDAPRVTLFVWCRELESELSVLVPKTLLPPLEQWFTGVCHSRVKPHGHPQGACDLPKPRTS